MAVSQNEVEQFLYREARCLDDKDYADSQGDKARERLKAYEQKKPWRE